MGYRLITTKAPVVSNWSPGTFNTSAYGTGWESTQGTTNSHAFHRAVFQTNSNKLLLQVNVGGLTILDVDLQEIDQNFKLNCGNNDVLFTIAEYQNNLWIYEPSSIIMFEAGETTAFKFKSKQGNKQVLRGMSEWGEI